jgi:hypothetical protein
MENTIDDLSVRTETGKKLSSPVTALLYKSTPWIKTVAVLGIVMGMFNLATSVYKLTADMPARALPVPGLQYFSVFAALLSIVSAYLLYQYAQKLKAYNLEENNQILREAFTKQRVYYTWTGVLAIFYVVVIIMFIIWLVPYAMSMNRSVMRH